VLPKSGTAYRRYSFFDQAQLATFRGHSGFLLFIENEKRSSMKTSSWTIEWSDDLSMSNPEIDAEHQHFIKLANELNDEIMSQHRGDKAAVEHIMCLLLEDAIAHFAHEEQILAEKAYPATQEHILIHSELINKFKQASKEIQNTRIRAAWIKTGLDIKDLMVNHLLVEDTKYIKHLQTE
jgi:hemerythrin-like metal-binding protein